jgi:glycine/D-amino acid oxidase-like deaminating enzyme
VVTRSKDLRTGHSIWHQTRARAVPHKRLTRDVEIDVLIIGAGITGTLIADLLTETGCKVLIVDRRGPAKGSTTASTALVQYEIDMPLTMLSRKIGKKDAVRAWRRSRLAIDALAARFGELGIDLAWRDTLYLAGDVLDRAGLEREHDARRAAGLSSRFLDRRALRRTVGIDRKAALLSFGNMLIDPRATTLAMLKDLTDRGVRIFSPVEITGIDAKKTRVVATTASGRKIRCDNLIFATGYEFPNAVPHKGHRITSTFAIATVRQPNRLWPHQYNIWESSDPYLYIRTTEDGRVICGGEDEDFLDETARDALLARKTKTLRHKLGRLLPDIDTRVDYAWTGSFGQTTTGLPSIGRVPHLPHCWAALGYGGNGITYARIAADVICGALNGRPDVDADLYDFRRSQ